MGTWDELCIICGISPSNDIDRLMSPGSYDVDNTLQSMALEITSNGVQISKEELTRILKDAFALIHGENPENDSQRSSAVIPDEDIDWEGFRTCCAIGNFEDEGGLEEGKTCTTTRRVTGGRCGEFEHVLDEKRVETDMKTLCTVFDTQNFFVSEACYGYLKAWLDVEPLKPTESDPKPLTIEDEFFEIVNSGDKGRDEDSLVMGCIDYDGIEETCEQFQSYYKEGRKGSKHTTKAIKEGKVGLDLAPAILRDFRCWMFKRTDIWPMPSDPFVRYPRPAPVQLATQTGLTSRIVHELPNELLFTILYLMPLHSVLAFRSTCRALHARTSAEDVMNRVLRSAVLTGTLRWILPVSDLYTEADNAYEVGRKWLIKTRSENSKPAGIEDKTQSPLLESDFPFYDFVRACFESDSMMNRKRIWGIVKQYDEAWKEYRRLGWEAYRS